MNTTAFTFELREESLEDLLLEGLAREQSEKKITGDIILPIQLEIPPLNPIVFDERWLLDPRIASLLEESSCPKSAFTLYERDRGSLKTSTTNHVSPRTIRACSHVYQY
jgi:hypothetical protein